MNDEFLHRLRARPPADFAARLKARLDAQPYRRRSWRYTGYLVAAALLGGVAVALILPRIERSDPTPGVATTTNAPQVTVPLPADQNPPPLRRTLPPLAGSSDA